jgi:hypothetical protein
MNQIKIAAVSALKQTLDNPRVVMTARFEQLKESIKADPGMLYSRPILAMGDGTVYAGNQRLHACIALFNEGWVPPWSDRPGTVPVLYDTQITREQAQARGIRDNLHSGDWQEIELAEQLTQIAAAEGDAVLPTLGFTDDDLRNIMAAAGIGTAVDPFSGRDADPEMPQDEPPAAQEGEDARERT